MKASSMRLSAMNFLAIREHSILELKNKLKNKFPERIEEVEVLLVQLQSESLLSDERFAEVFVRSRINKAYGPIKISYELTLKGISSAIIEYNMQLNDENWFAAMQKAWGKKFSGMESNSSQNNIKQFRYLYQRGFSSDQINAFIKSKE